MRRTQFVQIVGIVVLVALGTGCVNLAPTPGYGRAGDYVSVGMAGVKFNTDQNKTLRPTDFTAVFHHQATATDYPVAVLQVYRAYPDYTSSYAVQALDRSGDFGGSYSDVEPYDGQWWVTLKLDVPGGGGPITAPPGFGYLRVTPVNPADVYDTYGSDGDLANGWWFELIAGVASVDPAVAGQYGAYAPAFNLTVQPSAAYGVSSVGGFQIKLDYNIASLREVNSVKSPIIPRLVPISHDPNINIVQHTVDNGGGSHSLIAMVTNPDGFVASSAEEDWSPGNSIFKDLNMAIVVDDANNLASWSTDYTLDATDSFYVDLDGNELAGVEPTLGYSN